MVIGYLKSQVTRAFVVLVLISWRSGLRPRALPLQG